MATVVSRVHVKFGQLAEFYRVMEHVILPSVAGTGQTLVGSYQTVYGGSSFHEVLHVWDVEDTNATLRGLGAPGAFDAMSEAFAPLRDIVDNEAMTLMIRTPYHPH